MAYRLSEVLKSLPAWMAEPDHVEYIGHWVMTSDFVPDQPTTWRQLWQTSISDATFLAAWLEQYPMTSRVDCRSEITLAIIRSSRTLQKIGIKGLYPMYARFPTACPQSSCSWLKRASPAPNLVLCWADASNEYIKILTELFIYREYELALWFVKARSERLHGYRFYLSRPLPPTPVLLELSKHIQLYFDPIGYDDKTLFELAVQMPHSNLLIEKPRMLSIVEHVERCKFFTLVLLVAGGHAQLRASVRYPQRRQFFAIITRLPIELQEHIIETMLPLGSASSQPLVWSASLIEWAGF